MKALFFELSDHAIGRLRGSEVLLLNFSGERSDFVRFNRARIRQPGSVEQATLTLTLIDGGRRDSTTLTLALDAAHDRAALAHALDAMRGELAALPPDPYLLYATDATQSTHERGGRLPAAAEAVEAILAAAGDADLVGILASGPVLRGYASSLGSRHWHAVDSFVFDWSLYHGGDKAVKSTWAGADWNDAELRRRIDAARVQLPILARAPRTVEPGRYRAYLAPAAVDAIVSMLSWGGVSAKSQQTRQSALQQLVDGSVALAPQVHLAESTATGLAPRFDGAGFIRPGTVDLIRAGRHAGALVSARTAREYGLAANGANSDETMESLDLAGGTLAESAALEALERGIWIGNLWYLNWSDQPACRITGMTRFATFWVEDGRIVAPLNVMRFDDSIYRMLGANLEALTVERELRASSDTWRERSVQTSRVPGALLSSIALTL